MEGDDLRLWVVDAACISCCFLENPMHSFIVDVSMKPSEETAYEIFRTIQNASNRGAHL